MNGTIAHSLDDTTWNTAPLFSPAFRLTTASVGSVPDFGNTFVLMLGSITAVFSLHRMFFHRRRLIFFRWARTERKAVPAMKLLKNPFNTYRVTYGIVSPDTTQFKDYARMRRTNNRKINLVASSDCPVGFF